MLLQEEQHVIKWLSQYGALTGTQVIRLLHDKPQAVAEKIIHNLTRHGHIASISDGYYLGLDSLCNPDQRLLSAVWVLLQFIEKVDPMAHYPATYPSQLFFLKGDVGYEVVVLYEGEQHLAKLLQPQDDVKYIIVLPSISMVAQLRLPKIPCLFATVNYNGADAPTVNFYSEEDAHESSVAV